MPESTKEKDAVSHAPKTVNYGITKEQHDLVAGLLQQRMAIDAQLQSVMGAVLAGLPAKPREGARFVGTASGKKLGRVKYFLVFAS